MFLHFSKKHHQKTFSVSKIQRILKKDALNILWHVGSAYQAIIIMFVNSVYVKHFLVSNKTKVNLFFILLQTGFILIPFEF